MTEYVQPHSRETNSFAVTSMILGIVWFFWIGSILAVIFGHISLKQIGRNDESGKGMAVAGLALGYVGVATFILFVFLPLFAAAGSGY